MKNETPINQVILETVYAIEVFKKHKDDPKLIKALEEFGLIEMQGVKKRRFKKFTDEGVKKALSISINMEGNEDGNEKADD